MIFETQNQIKTKIKSLISPIQDGQTLFFGKTSDFPRFKLSESTLKRCIKIDKADLVIIGKRLESRSETCTEMYEDELHYYVLSDYRIRQANVPLVGKLK